MFSNFWSWLDSNTEYWWRPYRPITRTRAPRYDTEFDFRENDDDNPPSDNESTPTTPATPNKCMKIDLEIDDNTNDHHTDQYEITDGDEDDKDKLEQLVVRRGQPFNVTITLAKPYSEENDKIKIVFETSDSPSPRNYTQKELVVGAELKPNSQWSAALNPDKPANGKVVYVQIQPSAKAIVAKWSLTVAVSVKQGSDGERLRINEFKCKRSVYILFNAWCPEDSVYMDNEEWRDECVLQDDGYVYRGNRRPREQRGKAWQFSQFESFVLDCSLHLLDMKGSLLPYSRRGNPIYVSRELSSAVNAPDDNGVLVGNWSGNYTGGTRPTAWSDSADILEEFWRTKKPVKYGQCWVFSAVLNTVCRALGLPCRSVTNYASAHDTDQSCTIDTYYDTSGEKLDWLTSDSVWNFHVWNEAWMSRPDIGGAYGGWQVIDATPQELSGAEAQYKCGPASKHAIIQGDVGLPYDTNFVFSETSAQRFNWNKDSTTGEYVVSGPTTAVVGAEISTKKPAKQLSRWANDRDARLVLTTEYKYPDKSDERLASLVKATTIGSSDVNFYDTKEPDITVDMLDFEESIVVGRPFKVRIQLKNHSPEPRSLNAHIGICSCFNDGKPYKRMKNKIDVDETLNPDQEDTVVLSVEPDDYEGLVTDGCSFLVWIQGLVKETKQAIQDDRSYDLVIPDLDVEGPKEVKPGDDLHLTIKFTNPLHIRLTDCDFKISSPMMFRTKSFTFRNIKAEESIMIEKSYRVRRSRRYATAEGRALKVNVSFTSDQLDDVAGHHDILLVKN